MREKKLDAFCKVILTLAIALFAVLAVNSVNVYAEGGETVRVSTAKQLKAAMKNPDVGTIIFRTDAFLDITIKPVKGTEEKFLILDARNANITNKAVFAGISIGVLNSYTECVSGNKIVVEGFLEKNLVVAKKKQLESLTYFDAYFRYPEYILRKGAKLNNLVLVYTGNDAPEEFTYDAKKRQLKLETTAYDGLQSYVIKLDKSGRIVKNTCTTDSAEFAHDYTFKYDKNGNLVKISGKENENGVFTTTFTYENGLVTNENFVNTSFTAYSYETKNTYDKKGNLIHTDFHGIDSIDDQILESNYSRDYKYDEKGRMLWMFHDNSESGYTYEMTSTYNSKGFMTDTYENNGGVETRIKYTYSKAGDLIKLEYTLEGETYVYEYKYNKYGDMISTPEIDFEKEFPSWNPESASLKELVNFVIDSIDETSINYIDPADRIAVFDMDGTILCEKAPVYVDYCLTMYRVLDDETYKATPEEIDSAQQIRDHAYSEGKTFKPEGLKKDDLVASAFAGMTPEEFREYVVKFADNTDVVGFSGMKYGQSFYKPMIEVIDFLRNNGFDVWMVSACEREVVRALVERFDIPYDHVVATDVPYVASGLGDKAADDYNMSKDEVILLGAPLDEVECGKSGKSAAIAREIGKRPVLAFGNSSGDYSMLNYAEGNPYHTGMGFFIVCDDTEREYGSDEKAAEYYEEVEKEGWTAISMANDWKTIYGDGVQKTELPGTENTEKKAA